MIQVKAEFRGSLGQEGRHSKASKVIQLLQAAVNDPAFEQGVLATKYTDVRFLKGDGTPLKLTNEQIWSILRTGTEHNTAPDGEWDLNVGLYRPRWPWSSAIGYTEAGRISTTTQFFTSADPEDIASHWGHEWCHAAGFVHDFRHSARRGASVPYAVGELISKILA